MSFDQGSASDVYAMNVSDTYCTVKQNCQTNNYLDVRFDNRGAEERTIVAARLVSSVDCTGCGPNVRIGGSTPVLDEGGPERTLVSPVPLPAGSVTAVSFNFTYADGTRYDLHDGDEFVVALAFDDGSRSLYLVEAKNV